LERVHKTADRAFAEVRHVALALKAIDAMQRQQRHIGILYETDTTGSLLMLHLAWHLDLQNDQPKSEYIWVDPMIAPARAKQVAAFCRKVWRQNGKRVPYAFGVPNDCFDSTTGQFLFGPSRHGLTCATFVLAVFQATGFKLIDESTWRSRPGDVEWQQGIVGALRLKGADPSHVAAVENEVGAARFRPEDVGGAAAHEPWPVSFEEATRIGNQIVQLLNAVRPNGSIES